MTDIMGERDLRLFTPDEVCTLLQVKKSWLYDSVEAGACGWGSSFGSAGRRWRATWKQRPQGLCLAEEGSSNLQTCTFSRIGCYFVFVGSAQRVLYPADGMR